MSITTPEMRMPPPLTVPCLHITEMYNTMLNQDLLLASPLTKDIFQKRVDKLAA